MFGLQPIHIVIIVVLAVLLFGPKKLPEFGKSLGKSIREFKSASKDMTEDFKSAIADEGTEAGKTEASKKASAAPSQSASSQSAPSTEPPSSGPMQEHAQS